jgi:hypothetical protein
MSKTCTLLSPLIVPETEALLSASSVKSFALAKSAPGLPVEGMSGVPNGIPQTALKVAAATQRQQRNRLSNE